MIVVVLSLYVSMEVHVMMHTWALHVTVHQDIQASFVDKVMS